MTTCGWRGRATATPDLPRRVDVGAPVQQQPRDLDVVILRRDIEARDSILGRPQGCEDMRVRGTVGEKGKIRREADGRQREARILSERDNEREGSKRCWESKRGGFNYASFTYYYIIIYRPLD